MFSAIKIFNMLVFAPNNSLVINEVLLLIDDFNKRSNFFSNSKFL